MAYSGYRAAASSLVPWLWRGFGLCGGLALLRTLAAPGSGLSPLGRCALELLYGCVARCKHGVFEGGWDVGLGRGDGVLQLEHLLGHEAKHFLGLLQGVGRVCGPGEEPVPGACPVAAHVGRVAGGVACPRWGSLRGEGAFWRPLRPVEGVVQCFPGCLWGVGDACGESQAVSSAWWGRDFAVGGVCRCPSDLDTGSAQQGWTDRWAHVCASLHEGLHRSSLTSHTLEPAPTTAESHTGAAPPTGVWAYTRTLHREAAEALKTAISNHQGLVHTPHDNTQKGYTLWWHHPAPEGGLQPPADQPGIGPDLTAITRAVAAMAQQVGAPPQWAPSIIKETAARHNAAFAHFRGRPIHPTLPDLDLPAHDAWAVHILVPHDTAPKTGDATARITKQLPNTALHYDIPTPNVIVTHNTGRDHYYLQATHERSPITVYTFTTYPGLQPPQHHPRPAWKHPLHVAPTPRKRPTHHAPPPAESTALHTARRRAAAHHQSHLLPRINAGPGTVTEATHKSTLNLLARKLRPKMALEDTLWIYYGEGRTARVADLRNIIPRHIQRAVGPFTVYAVPHPITAPCTHCNPLCALPCAGALQQPLPTPTYRGGKYLGTVPGDPHPYLLPAADRHHAIPLHLVEHLAVGPSPFQKRPPHTPSDGRPPDEPTHATPGPKRTIALLTLKAEAAIPRDLEGENHLMVEGLTEHVLIAAMYATASASRLWEDRPSPPLAQAPQDAPDTGPTAEDIHQILNMRAPPKTHPAVRPIQLVSWDAMDAPPTTTEVHILKHRDTWWTVEWDDHGCSCGQSHDDHVPGV